MKARAVVGDDIQRSREVEGFVAVAVFALVGALDVAEVSGGAVVGDSPFGDPGDGRSVVGASGNGGIASIEVGGDDHQLPKEGRVLHVTVGDDSVGICGGHQELLHLRRVGQPPGVRLSFGTVEDPTHSHLGGISGSREAGVLRDEFSKVSGSVA